MNNVYCIYYIADFQLNIVLVINDLLLLSKDPNYKGKV